MSVNYEVVKFPLQGEEDSEGVERREDYCFTFLINGQPTLRFFNRCTLQNMPETYYVDRCIGRLREGRSDVFGGPRVMMGGQEITRGTLIRTDEDRRRLREILGANGANEETVNKIVEQLERTQSSNGQQTNGIRASVKQIEPLQSEHESRSGKKVVRDVPQWKYTLDGKDSEETFATEKEAREACACKAWVTAGKLGKLSQIQDAFKAQMGKDGEAFACTERHRVLVRSGEDEYSPGFQPDGSITFKQVNPDPQYVSNPNPEGKQNDSDDFVVDDSSKPDGMKQEATQEPSQPPTTTESIPPVQQETKTDDSPPAKQQPRKRRDR
jgi:hypothetical protein